MKLTLASRYALHAVVYLANLKKNDPIASQLIAQARGIDPRFLLKVLKPLVGAQVLISAKGPNASVSLEILRDDTTGRQLTPGGCHRNSWASIEVLVWWPADRDPERPGPRSALRLSGQSGG